MEYNIARGRLLLQHAYPKHARPIPHVSVDVNLILETTQSSVFQSGNWVNVIGYVRKTQLRNRKEFSLRSAKDTVSVQAILIWDAGALRIDGYENTLEELKLLDSKNLASQK